MSDAYDYATTRIPSDWARAIEGFWERFCEAAPHIDAIYSGESERGAEDAASMTIAAFEALPIPLQWEYGPGEDGGHFLAISSELSRDAHVLARAVLRAAPHVDNFEFADARPAIRQRSLIAEFIENRSASPLAISHAQFSEGAARAIDVAAVAARRGADPALAAGQAELFLSLWLGEHSERVWLGDFGASSTVSPGFSLLSKPDPFDALRTGAELESLIDALRARCPDQPITQMNLESEEWAVMEAEPIEADDYAFRADTVTALTAFPEIIAASLSGQRFRSERFSRHAECFCYLKVDGFGSDGLRDPDVRRALELLIDKSLRPRELGSSFGGATGLRYLYVDFVITDPLKNIDILRAALREGRLPERSWIHFYDDGLDHFGVPVWPDGPAPPMIEHA